MPPWPYILDLPAIWHLRVRHTCCMRSQSQRRLWPPLLTLKFGNGWMCCGSSRKKFNSCFQFQFQVFHFQFHKFQFQFQNWNWPAIPNRKLNWPQPWKQLRFGVLGIFFSMHGRNGLRFDMHPDHLWYWLHFCHGLLIFRILVAFLLGERGQICGFQTFSWKQEWAEIWYAYASWPPPALITFLSWSVDFPHFCHDLSMLPCQSDWPLVAKGATAIRSLDLLVIPPHSVLVVHLHLMIYDYDEKKKGKF